MYTSKLSNYIEKLDPYYTGRIILRKGIFLATLLTLVNWVFRPSVFNAYAIPAIFLTAYYEMPMFTTYKAKEQVLVISFILTGFSSIFFYLLFPFKFYLAFFAVLFYGITYFTCNHYYPVFKPLILPTVMISALTMNITPGGELQLAIDMFFCNMLSLLVCYLGLKLHPNLYHLVWLRAFKLYLAYVISKIDHFLNNQGNHDHALGIRQLNIMRIYRRLYSKKRLAPALRIGIALRNISQIINYVENKPKELGFWVNLEHDLVELHKSVCAKKKMALIAIPIDADFHLQRATKLLNIIIYNWNKLCLQI